MQHKKILSVNLQTSNHLSSPKVT